MKRNPVFSRGRFGVAGRFAGAILLALSLVQSPVRADGPDDDYLTIAAMIDQGDALSASGQISEAHQKYVLARESLAAFRRDNPDWNPQTVNLRLRQLGEKAARTLATANPTPPKTVVTPPSSPVTLLTNGSEPRQVLRLHPQAGDSQELVFTMKMSMAMSMAGKAMPAAGLPAMNITSDLKVEDVTPTGDITYTMKVKDFDVAADASLPPAAVTALKGVFDKLKGMAGTGHVSASGLVQRFDMQLPPGADPQLSQMMDQMKDSFKNSFQALPEAAVGVGARWECKTRTKSQGMSISQTITSELAAADGDHLTVNMTLLQTAASQKITNPAMPSLSVDLVRMNGTGTGKSVIDLSKLTPVSGNLDETIDMAMSMKMGATPQTMEMKMSMNMSYTAN